jgi:type II secretion system protein I
MRSRRPRRRSKAGFTLVEVLVALVLFAIVASGLAAFAVQSIRRTSDTRAATGAVLIAQERLENLRGLEYDDIAGSITTETIDGMDYGVDVDVDDDTPAANMKQVTINVDWDSPMGSRTYVLETILTDITPE